MALVPVFVSDTVEAAEALDSEPRRADVDLADLLVATDLVATSPPGVIRIDDVIPRRFRAGDQLRIVGDGFSASPGNNTVQIAGLVTPIVSVSQTELVVTAPAGLTAFPGSFVYVVVESPAFSTSFGRLICWSKPPNPGKVIPPAAPLTDDEQVLLEFADLVEAKDWERLATYVEFLTRDQFADEGDMPGFDGTGYSGVGVAQSFGVGYRNSSPLGMTKVADSTIAEGVRAGWSQDLTAGFGGTIPAGVTALRLLVAGADQAEPVVTSGPTFQHAPSNGTIDLVWLLVEAGGGSSLDQVQIRRNFSVVFDSGTGLGIANDQTYAANPSVSVAKGDRIEVRVLKAGPVGQPISMVGGVRFALS